MGDSANVSQERRKTPRTVLNKILYVNLEPGNGGIVLNLCDGGLAFHCVAPVQQQGPVRLWFSLSNDHRLEASGELVWTDPKKKTGGVRFTNLPDSTREHIRNLLGQSSVLGSAPAIRPKPSPVASEEAVPRREAALPVRQVNPPPYRLQALSADLVNVADVADVADFPKNAYPNDPWAALTSRDEGPSLGRVLSLLIVSILMIAGGLLVYGHSYEVRMTLLHWRDRLEGNLYAPPQISQQDPAQGSPQISQAPADQPTAPVQALAPIPVPDSPAASAAPIEPTQDPAADVPPAREAHAVHKAVEARRASRSFSPRAAPAPAAAERRESAPSTQDDGEADLALAQQYLSGTDRIRNSPAAAQFLWAAVSKGSPDAELMLAHLYINGDGVAKNCEQARVLLRAASGQGNVEAMDALKNLRTHCH